MQRSRRYLLSQLEADLERKMVFVSGPRQVGKTTLALNLPAAEKGYLNWDVAEHRNRILRRDVAIACDLTELTYALHPWKFEPGVYKYRSFEEAQRQRLAWERRQVRARSDRGEAGRVARR